MPDEVEADVQRIEATPQAFRQDVPEQVADIAPTTQSARPASPASIADLEPALRELFAVERAQDLSSRIGNTPIADLSVGLPLNERIQFAAELFSGDADLMLETLRKLNGAASYDQAAVSLASTARRFDWGDGEKHASARAFVKRVWRRFA